MGRLSISPFPGVWAWFLGRFLVGPVCGLCLVLGSLCNGYCFPLLLGGRFSVFFFCCPGSGGACPAGVGYMMVLVSG